MDTATCFILGEAYSCYRGDLARFLCTIAQPILLGYTFQLNNLETNFILIANCPKDPTMCFKEGKKKNQLLTVGNCRVQKSAFLSPSFSSPVSIFIEVDGELINSHWALKGEGFSLQPSVQANITLCLLAPPTPPPHICLYLEIFSSLKRMSIQK